MVPSRLLLENGPVTFALRKMVQSPLLLEKWSNHLCSYKTKSNVPLFTFTFLIIVIIITIIPFIRCTVHNTPACLRQINKMTKRCVETRVGDPRLVRGERSPALTSQCCTSISLMSPEYVPSIRKYSSSCPPHKHHKRHPHSKQWVRHIAAIMVVVFCCLISLPARKSSDFSSTHSFC